MVLIVGLAELLKVTDVCIRCTKLHRIDGQSERILFKETLQKVFRDDPRLLHVVDT